VPLGDVGLVFLELVRFQSSPSQPYQSRCNHGWHCSAGIELGFLLLSAIEQSHANGPTDFVTVLLLRIITASMSSGARIHERITKSNHGSYLARIRKLFTVESQISKCYFQGAGHRTTGAELAGANTTPMQPHAARATPS
jgi:hypothetical protein